MTAPTDLARLKLATIHTDDGEFYYVKEHIDVSKMRALVNDQTNGEADGATVEVFYAWLRTNPDPSGQYNCLVVNGTPGRAGTFPATVATHIERHGYKCYARRPPLETP